MKTSESNIVDLDLSSLCETPWRDAELNRLTLENAAFRTLIETMSRAVAMNQDPPEDSEILLTLSELLSNALLAVNACDGSLLVVDQETHDLVFVIVHGQAHERLSWRCISNETGVAGWVARHGEATLVGSASTDPRFDGKVDRLIDYQTHSILAVPVIRGGQTIGVMEAINHRGHSGFSDEDQATFALITLFVADLLGVVIDRADAKSSAKKKTPVRKTGTRKKVAKKTPAKKKITKKKITKKKTTKKKTTKKKVASKPVTKTTTRHKTSAKQVAKSTATHVVSSGLDEHQHQETPLPEFSMASTIGTKGDVPWS